MSFLIYLKTVVIPDLFKILLPAAAILIARPELGWAELDIWQSGSGDWSKAARWNLGHEPSPTDDASIRSGGTVTISRSGETCHKLYIDAYYGVASTVQMSALVPGVSPSLGASNGEYVGYSSLSIGVFSQDAGFNALGSGYLYLGYQSGAAGYYVLSGTGSLVAASEYIGGSGSGTFTQTGGTNTIAPGSGIFISNGTYNLSGSGQIEALESGFNTCQETVGTGGTFMQSGGTNTLNGQLHVSNGTYQLSGSAQLSVSSGASMAGGQEFVQAGGTFTQSGGTNTIGGELYLNGSSALPASYVLTDTGYFTTTFDFIGETGFGTFTQSGGTHTVLANLTLASSSASQGTYNLNGGTLILDLLRKGSGTATFNFGGGTLRASGTMSSSLPMNLTGTGGNATVDTQNYAVALSGDLTGTGGLTKSGAGTLTLSAANNYNGTTTVAGGTLELGTAPARHPIFDLGGADIQHGKMVFDYASGSSPAATIKGLLTASYHGGLWDVGQFKSSTATTTGLTLGWLDDGSSAVTVMATYPGDFNLDGVVDNLDKSIWFAHAFTGTTWQQGDTNYDGAVNGLDRDLWFAHVGMPPIAGLPAAAGVTPVPEPGTLVLLATSLIGLLTCNRWCRRK
jgi:autotransporter-associated beta strand protein